MPRRKRAKRNPQRPKDRQYGRIQIQRPRLSPMVPTTGLCATGKLRYGTSADAQLALEYAQANREILGSERVEKRWYPKPGDKPCPCGGFHLTSTDPMPPKRGPKNAAS